MVTIDKSKLFVRVLTTSRCNLHCPECNQREWKDINYDITPEQIEYFLDIAKKSGYGIDVMNFGAREPTMNPFLADIIRTTKKKGVRLIWLLTNGFNIDSLVPVKELIDKVQTSSYGKLNFDAVEKTKEIFGEKVEVWEIIDHRVIKNEPAAENEPIDCCTTAISLFANKVYACAPVVNLFMRFPGLVPKEDICTDVSLHFLENLKTIDKGGTKYCYFCTDNLNVASTLKKALVYIPLSRQQIK